MTNDRPRFTIIPGEVDVWLEQEAVHIKAVTKEGDPVELTGKQARDLAEALKRLSDLCDAPG